MEVKIAVSKINKYAVSKSGDTVEIVERPNGGVSVVMADGQSSGHGAKHISILVVRKVISLLADGVRDGAAARAASDYLYTERGGRVSSTLNIVSIDQQSNTLVITRNNPAPVLLTLNESIQVLQDECSPIGLYRGTRPNISEISLQPGLLVVLYTDGLIHAGSRYGLSMDVTTCLEALIEDWEDPSPQMIADSLLEHALKLDQGRPADDISIVVITIAGQSEDLVRRMYVRLHL